MKVIANTEDSLIVQLPAADCTIEVRLPNGQIIKVQYNQSDSDNPGLNLVLPSRLKIYPWEGNLHVDINEEVMATQVWIDLPPGANKAARISTVRHIPIDPMTPEDAFVKYTKEEIDLPQLLKAVGQYVRDKQKSQVGKHLGAMGRCYPWNRTVAKRLQSFGLDVTFVKGRFIGTKDAITHYWTRIGDFKLDITGNQFKHQTDQPAPPPVYVFMEDARYVEEDDVTEHLKLASPE